MTAMRQIEEEEERVRTTAADAVEGCFHCGLPIAKTVRYQAAIAGGERRFCCAGCQAVAQAIERAGLGEYYRHRTQPGERADGAPEILKNLLLYDEPAVQKSFVRTESGQIKEASLILEGIHCAACVWLNERHLQAMPGVLEVGINYSTQRARIRWDAARIKLSEIIAAVAAIGYRAHPFDPGKREQLMDRERRGMLRRVYMAGLAWAQVMMLSVALYAGDYYGMNRHMAEFFRYVSLLFTLPVLFYSAWPFLRGAWFDLRRGQLGMDVPVTLGILAAFLPSAWNTVVQPGPVYYDTVTMFVFFLLGARFLEMTARRKAAHALDALSRVIPAMARRVRGTETDWVPITEVQIGNCLLVQPGETVPLDGEVIEGRSDVDESLLTGESRPIPKSPGSQIIGGTVNQENPLRIRVLRVGEDLVINGIARLLEQAQAERPPIAFLADRASRWFVMAVLLLAVLTGVIWYFRDPSQIYWVVVSMLVVTCPCALGLATPVAITAATGRLARAGAVMTRGHALEDLAKVTHVIFDKTGTLSEGRLRVRQVFSNQDLQGLWHRTAALAQNSEHPLSRSLSEAAKEAGAVPIRVEAAVNKAGAGLEARMDGAIHRLGKLDFVAEIAGTVPAAWETQLQEAQRQGYSLVGVGKESAWLGIFALGDTLRPDARRSVAHLQAKGYQVWLLSGDHEIAVAKAAQEAGIEHWHAGLDPSQKLAQLRALQDAGAVVCMVGDGINDGPVLAGAQVSMAMGSGTAVARAGADIILLSNQLGLVARALRLGRDTIRVIRENLVWALLYNGIALPVAMTGILTPWMAALGMSASSLIVVANAMRLVRQPDDEIRLPAVMAKEGVEA